jgi:hypothetical protein
MKKTKLILFLWIIASNGIAISQPALINKISLADSLREQGDLKGALIQFKKDYLKDPVNRRNIYNYACALSLDQQADSSFRYLTIAVKIDTSLNALTDPDFITLREDYRWKDFENKLISMANIKYHNPFTDIEYSKALWRMMASDQAYFYEIGVGVRKLGPDSPVVRALWKYKNSINKKNQQELEELIAKKGWPKNSDVGSAAAGAAFYVIQHADTEMQQKYLPLLKERCEEKEASWSNYAMMYDRMKVSRNLPQKYGTQPVLNNENSGAFGLAPLEDETKVNEWRKEIGLPPLQQYLKN